MTMLRVLFSCFHTTPTGHAKTAQTPVERITEESGRTMNHEGRQHPYYRPRSWQRRVTITIHEIVLVPRARV